MSRKNFLASLSSSRGTFVGSSKRRRSRRAVSCITKRRCRNSVGMFTMCGFGARRTNVKLCRNRRGRFTRSRR